MIKTEGIIRTANTFYQEVIPGELTYATPLTISHKTAWDVNKKDGSQEMDRTLTSFGDSWRNYFILI